MGFFKNLLNNLANSDDDFIDLVRANENGEKWANEEISRLWNSGDQTLHARYQRACAAIYENSAKNGDRKAILKYARGLAWSGKENESVSWYMKLINQGDTEAMLELSFEYSEYGGLATNQQSERAWIRKAAEAGNAEAQYKLGLEYSCDGKFEEAAIWYQKSAEQGNPDAKGQYAKHLSTDNLNNFIFSFKNMDSNDPQKEYLADEIVSLYSYIENLLIDALNESDSESTISSAYMDLALLYLRDVEPIITPLPYRSAFFDYMAYYYFELEFSFNRMKRTIQEFNLQVNNSTLQEWQVMSVDEWAAKHEIEI